MNFEIRWINVQQDLQLQRQPQVLLERDVAGGRATSHLPHLGSSTVARVGEFWVPTNALNSDEIDFSLTTMGDHVRVPIHGYRTLSAKAALVGAGYEHATRAMAAFYARAPHKQIDHVFLIMGEEVNQFEESFEYYLGVALRVA